MSNTNQNIHILAFIVYNYIRHPELYVMFFTTIKLLCYYIFKIRDENDLYLSDDQLTIYSLLLCMTLSIIYNTNMFDTYMMFCLLMKIFEYIIAPITIFIFLT